VRADFEEETELLDDGSEKSGGHNPMSQYKLLITSRPCGKTDELLAIVPRVKMLFPGLTIETDVQDDNCKGEGFPQTRFILNERIVAILYGFRTEEQHLAFISTVVDVDWVCRLAS
jgi:hypothetical protein